VTNDEESGDNVIQVGVDLDCQYRVNVRQISREWHEAPYFFKLIQICFAFE
jgi:hypothetical protein